MAEKNGFQGTVLTHLSYIKEKLNEHDKKFEKIIDGFSSQIKSCDKRFDGINKEVDSAKGFAKGAMFVGGGGMLGGIMSWVKSLFGGV